MLCSNMVSLADYKANIKVLLQSSDPDKYLREEYGMAGDAATSITRAKAFISSSQLSRDKKCSS